jgi:hypothetical protein
VEVTTQNNPELDVETSYAIGLRRSFSERGATARAHASFIFINFEREEVVSKPVGRGQNADNFPQR